MDLERLFLESFCEFLKTKNFKINSRDIIQNFYKNRQENQENQEDNIETLEIFTDGSVINNGKRNSKGGYGVYIDDSRKFSFSYDEEFWGCPATNQNCELLALNHAVGIIKRQSNKIQNFIVYSDSMYSINCITKWCKAWKKNGWKTSNNEDVKNKEIIENIMSVVTPLEKRISFVHVRSHTREPSNKSSKDWKMWFGNDMADKLAKKGMNEERKN